MLLLPDAASRLGGRPPALEKIVVFSSWHIPFARGRVPLCAQPFRLILFSEGNNQKKHASLRARRRRGFAGGSRRAFKCKHRSAEFGRDGLERGIKRRKVAHRYSVRSRAGRFPDPHGYAGPLIIVGTALYARRDAAGAKSIVLQLQRRSGP